MRRFIINQHKLKTKQQSKRAKQKGNEKENQKTVWQGTNRRNQLDIIYPKKLIHQLQSQIKT